MLHQFKCELSSLEKEGLKTFFEIVDIIVDNNKVSNEQASKIAVGMVRGILTKEAFFVMLQALYKWEINLAFEGKLDNVYTKELAGMN